MAGQSLQKLSGSYNRELKKLRADHHLIIRLAATGDYTQAEIGEIVGCTKAKVNYTVNSRLGKQKMAYLQDKADARALDVMGEIQALAPFALAELEEALMSDKLEDKEKIKVAQDLLDRAGYGKTRNLNVRSERVTDDDIREIKQEAKRETQSGEEGSIEDAKVLQEYEGHDESERSEGIDSG